MIHTIPSRAIALVLVAGQPLVGCQCTEPRIRDDLSDQVDGSSDGQSDAGSDGQSNGHASTGASTGAAESTTTAAEEPVDVSRFMGVFHYDHPFIPFGEESPQAGQPYVGNLEIRPDGTASLTTETCNDLVEPDHFEWRWEALPGPMLVFHPGPGEESLRFMARADLESLYATLGNDCAIVFDAKGEGVWTVSEFYPGRACWVNRCETWNTVHIDYCEGEEPPPCE